MDIDFVNLRSETYADGSRIPEMQFGTPKEVRLSRDPSPCCAAVQGFNAHGHSILLGGHVYAATLCYRNKGATPYDPTNTPIISHYVIAPSRQPLQGQVGL